MLHPCSSESSCVSFQIRSDEETRNDIEYSLIGPAADAGLFTVGKKNGYVRIHGILDREKTAMYEVSVSFVWLWTPSPSNNIKFSVMIMMVVKCIKLLKVVQMFSKKIFSNLLHIYGSMAEQWVARSLHISRVPGLIVSLSYCRCGGSWVFHMSVFSPHC